ncbi:hypothetical protein AAHH80_41755, partial [Burkholderia pseudomallei]
LLHTDQNNNNGETIREALGQEPSRPAAIDGLEALPQRFEVVDASAPQVKDFIAAHTGACGRDVPAAGRRRAIALSP